MEARLVQLTRLKKRSRPIEVKDVNMNSQTQPKKGTCGCGRSPTGNCVGWHALSEEAYKKKLREHLEKNLDKKR